jgi:DNA invertase Pin-like site-specific DNA recombinase
MTKHHDLIKPFAKGDREKIEKKSKNQKAVIYTRVSSKEQVDNMSLETQLKFCNEFAKRYNYEIRGHFGGTYESAMSDERKEFVRMITFAKKSKEKISYIIVYSLERFSRTGDNAIWLSRQLRELGVTIVSVTQPIDTSNPSGVLQQNILFLFGQYDNDLRRQKCVAGMKEKLLKGEWIGVVPLGYKYDRAGEFKEQRIILNDDAPLIRKAFQMKLHGASNVLIAETISKKGLRLTEKRLTETLRNPFYCGYVSHNLLDGELVKGKHPALISEELLLQVNDILKGVPQGYKWKEENESLPMRKFIKCADCGGPFTGYYRKKVLKNGKVLDFHYYKCNTKHCKCNRSNKHMHEKFAELLNQYQLDRNLIPVIKKQLEITLDNLLNSSASSSKSMIAKLSDLKIDLGEVNKRFAIGKIDRSLYEQTKYDLEKEIREISDELEKSTFNLSNPSDLIEKGIVFASELANCWLNGDYEERQTVQDILFPNGIIYDREKDAYRTSGVNEVIDLITELSATYTQKKERQTNTSIDLSPPVARGGVEPPSVNRRI